MSAVVWQCVCGARLEADPDDKGGATLIVDFTELHAECPATWRARWYPERETSQRDTLTERAVGFEIPGGDD